MLKCLHCLYEWESHTKNPKCCPKCKSYKWRTSLPDFTPSEPITSPVARDNEIVMDKDTHRGTL